MKNDYDDALAVTCPNCGAPIPMLGAKHCEYCGCAIIELNIHAWAFHHVEEITAKSKCPQNKKGYRHVHFPLFIMPSDLAPILFYNITHIGSSDSML